MSTPPIRIPISADDQYSAEFQKLKARIAELEAAVSRLGGHAANSFHEARGAAALLGDELGIKLNRHLRSILSSSELIGPILSAAFPVVAALGFLEVAEKIPEQIEKATNALAGYSKASQAEYEDAIKANQQLLIHFKTVAEGYALLQQLREKASSSSRTGDAAADPFKFLGEAFGSGGIGGAASQLFANLKVRSDADKESAETNKQMLETMARINELQVEHNKKLEEATKKAEQLRKELEKEGDAIFRAVAALSDNSLASKGRIAAQLAPGFSQTDPLLSNPTPSDQLSKQHIQNLKDQAGWYEATRTSSEKYVQAIEDLNREFENDKSSETYRRALEQVKDQFDESHKAALQLGAAFGDALKEGVLMGRSWQNVLESLIVTIAQLIVKMYVLKALQASSFGSSGFGGFLTALVGGFAGKAGGGPVSGGVPYMVGENGPELFMPSTSGSIVPNGKWGGGGNVYNIDARGAEMGVEQKIIAAMQIAENRAVARSVGIVRENSLRGRG